MPLCVGVALALPGSALCETTLKLGLDQRFSYNDNYRLQRTPEEISGYKLTPKASFKVEQERLRFEADLEADFGRFSDDRLDSDDQEVNLLGVFESENSEFQITANMDRASTRSGEEFGSDVVEVFATRRVAYDSGVSWSRDLNERNRLSVGGGYARTNYDSTAFSDYEIANVYLGWTHILSPVSSLQVTLSANEFETRFDNFIDENNFGKTIRESETTNLQLAYSRAFSQRWSGSFALGFRDTSTVQFDAGRRETCAFAFFGICLVPGQPEDFSTSNDADTDGTVGNVEFNYRGERFVARFGGSRSITPSGLSLLLEQTQLFMNLDWRVNEKVNVALNGRYSDAEDIEFGTFDRTILRVGPRVRWRFAQHWTLEGGYQYADRDVFRNQDIVTDILANESGNEIFLNLRYDREPVAF